MEDGYTLIGFSSFNAKEGSAKDAIQQAKKIKAGVVVLYSRYTHTVSGTTPLLIPNPSETYTTYHSGTVAGSSYSGTSTTIVPGGYTALGIPYSVNRYDFFAAYWVKLKPLAFGAHVGDMPEDLRQKLQRNRGAYVAFVVKGSPAFNADILRGDVITRIGDDEIIDSKSVIHLINKYAGQEVPLEFIRNGETRKISIKLRERSQ